MRLHPAWTSRALLPLLLTVVSGCDGRMTTITVPATPDGAGVSTATANDFNVDKSGFPCVLRVASPTPFPQVPGEAGVGYKTSYWSKSYYLYSCHANTSRRFRGFATIDLAPLRAELARGGREVGFASLRFRRKSHRTNTTDLFPNSCAATLSAATGPERAVTTPGRFISDLPDDPVEGRFSVNVTETVREWVSGRLPNHGFFIDGVGAPPRRDAFDDCITVLHQFQLVIDLRNAGG